MKFYRILLIISVIVIISSLFAVSPSESFRYAVKIILFISMTFYIPDFIRNKKQLNIFVMTIVISLSFVSTMGLIQYLALQSGQETFGQYLYTNTGEISRLGGLTGANAYAQELMAGIPFLTFLVFNHKKTFVKFILFCILMISLVSLGLTISRTHIMGFMMFLFVYFFLNLKHRTFTKKQLFSLSVFLIVLAIIVSTFLISHMSQRSFEGDDNSSNIRYHVFLEAVELLKEKPFFGIGFNNLEIINSMNYKPGLTFGRAGHDIVSIIFVSVGIPGSLIFIALFYIVLKYLSVSLRRFASQENMYLVRFIITIKAAFIAQLFTGFGNSVLLGRIFWIYVALTLVIYRWSALSPDKNKDHLSNFNKSLLGSG